MDHVRDPVTADGLDGEVHVLQAESMRRDLFQWEAMRGELRERELARLVAVAARALRGDRLHREAANGKVRELGHFALDDDGSGLAFHRLDAEQDRDGPRARGAIEHHVDTLVAGDLHDAGERIFLVHVDHMVGAKELRDFEPGAVLRRSRDDDEGCPRLLADHRLRKALLARALDEHGGVVADFAIE